MKLLRWIPLVIALALIVGTLGWVALQPIEDTAASLKGFLLMCVLCLAAVPAMHLAADL